jgi:foldase protein PrsA
MLSSGKRVSRQRLVPLFALGIVVTTVLGLSACGNSSKPVRVPLGAVVSVDGELITPNELDHWMMMSAKASWVLLTQTPTKPFLPDPPTYKTCIPRIAVVLEGRTKKTPTRAMYKRACERLYGELKDSALEELLPMQWELAEASGLGVKVSAAEVQQRFQMIKQHQFPTKVKLQAFLAKTGYTIADLMLKTKVAMVSAIIHRRRADEATKTVTQAFIAKYYDEHKSQFVTPERRNIQIIMTKTEAQANEAKRKLQATSNFVGLVGSGGVKAIKRPFLVREQGSAQAGTANAEGGVELQEVTSGQAPEPLDHAIFAAKVNIISGPIKGSGGYYIFEVERVVPQSPPAPLAQVQQELTARLIATAEQQATDAAEKKWTALTECRNGYVGPGCKDYRPPKKQ